MDEFQQGIFSKIDPKEALEKSTTEFDYSSEFLRRPAAAHVVTAKMSWLIGSGRTRGGRLGALKRGSCSTQLHGPDKKDRDPPG